MKKDEKKPMPTRPVPPTPFTEEVPAPDYVRFSDVPVAIMGEQGHQNILSDVLGSYTGTPVDGDMPEQDADDL